MQMMKKNRSYAKAGDYGFYYSSIIFSGGAAVTELLTVSSGYLRKYEGKKSLQITLAGRLMPMESGYFSQMISTLSAASFSLSIGEKVYNECVMSYGETKFSENSFLGEFKMIFKEIN